MTKNPAARLGLIGCLVLSTTLFAATAALGQAPEAVARYLDLVARYRGGEDPTAVLEILPLEGTWLVVHKLLSEPESCPGTMCLEAAALMHTDAALTLLSRGRVADTDSQLQTARWLLGFDVRFDDLSSDLQESEESVEAKQAFRRAWLLATAKLLMPHGYPSKALSYFEDCLELFPVGADSLLATGSAQELMGLIDGLVPVPASPRGGRRLGPHLPEALPRFEERQRQTMQRALRAAEEHYRRAIQLEPGLAEAHLRLGRVLQRRNRAKQARSELSWVIENSTHNPAPGPRAALSRGAGEEPWAMGRGDQAFSAGVVGGARVAGRLARAEPGPASFRRDARVGRGRPRGSRSNRVR